MGQLTQQETTSRNDGEMRVRLCVHMYSMQVCVRGVVHAR